MKPTKNPAYKPHTGPVRYNTGKVIIGLAYVPRQRWEPSADAFRLQTALLEGKQPRPCLLKRFFGSML